MAIGRLSLKVGGAGKAGAHAAYIARIGPYANRLERGEKLEATTFGNMPTWAESNPLYFWEAADAHERRNGTTYREMEIALPRELSAPARLALVQAFVEAELGERHAYQFAIHTPRAVDGGEQPHAHLMFSERQVDGVERDPEQYFKRYNRAAPERGGARKGYGERAGETLTRAERVAALKALRSRWEVTCNAHLLRAGVAVRIDLRSYADQGVDRAPERKQLPSEWRDAAQRGQVLEFRGALRAEAVSHRSAEVFVASEAREQALPQAVKAGMRTFNEGFELNERAEIGMEAFSAGFATWEAQQRAEEVRRLQVEHAYQAQQEQQRIAAQRLEEARAQSLKDQAEQARHRHGRSFGPSF